LEPVQLHNHPSFRASETLKTCQAVEELVEARRSRSSELLAEPGGVRQLTMTLSANNTHQLTQMDITTGNLHRRPHKEVTSLSRNNQKMPLPINHSTTPKRGSTGKSHRSEGPDELC